MIGELTKAEGTEQKLVLKSLGAFSCSYAAALVVLLVVTTFFEIDLGTGGNIAAVVAAGMLAGTKFANIVKRIPDKSERTKLTLGCLVVSFAISFLLAALITLALPAEIQNSTWQALASLPVVFFLGAIVFVTVLYFGVIWFAVGMGAKNAVKQLSKNEA